MRHYFTILLDYGAKKIRLSPQNLIAVALVNTQTKLTARAAHPKKAHRSYELFLFRQISVMRRNSCSFHAVQKEARIRNLVEIIRKGGAKDEKRKTDAARAQVDMKTG